MVIYARTMCGASAVCNPAYCVFDISALLRCGFPREPGDQFQFSFSLHVLVEYTFISRSPLLPSSRSTRSVLHVKICTLVSLCTADVPVSATFSRKEAINWRNRTT